MNEDGIIKEKGFCFVPAFKTVNKAMPRKSRDGVTDRAGLSAYRDNAIPSPCLPGAAQATQQVWGLASTPPVIPMIVFWKH